MIQIDVRRLLAGIALIAAGMLAGAAMETSNEAHGEIRTPPPPPAFQSGGQLSVPVLKEISATVQQIDARLARMETVAQALLAPRDGD